MAKLSSITTFLILLLAVHLAYGNEEAIRSLISKLNHPDLNIKMPAVAKLGTMGQKAESAVPALIEALTNKNPEVRIDIIRALESIRRKTKIAPQVLTVSLSNDKCYGVRQYAARALGEICFEGKMIIPELTIALNDKYWKVRKEAAIAIVKIGAQTEIGIQILTDAFKEENWFVRVEAARALGKMGKKSESAVPYLISSSLYDAHYEVRLYVVEALGEIGHKTAVGPLSRLTTEDEDALVRKAAKKAIIKIMEKQKKRSY